MKSRNYYVELVLEGELTTIKEFVSANSKGILLLSDVPCALVSKRHRCSGRAIIGVTNVEPWVPVLLDKGIRIVSTRIRGILDLEWLEVLRSISLLNLKALDYDR